MSSSYFEGAESFTVGDMKVNNVSGNYTDQRHTSVEENKIRRQAYDQRGAVGVVNGRGKFTGTINHSGATPTHKTPKGRSEPFRSQTTPNYAPYEDTGDTLPPPQSRGNTSSGTATPQSGARSGNDSSYFKGAKNFGIGSMDITNTSGDYTDARSTHIQRNRIREKYYDQQGAIGVVNDRGTFSGTVNYGQRPLKSKKYKLRHAEPSSDEESDSEDESSDDDDDYRWGSRYNQRGAVGVVNDRGRFSGNINYNTAPQRQGAKERRERRGGYAENETAGYQDAPDYGRGAFTPGYKAGPPPIPQYGAAQQGFGGRGYYQDTTLGLGTPPFTPGAWPQGGGRPGNGEFADKNPFRRMTAPTPPCDVNGLESQMSRMSMQNPQAAYPSPYPTGYRPSGESEPFFTTDNRQ